MASQPYAETISVYGTEDVFTDGDDTPWSKGFPSHLLMHLVALKCALLLGTGSEGTNGPSRR